MSINVTVLENDFIVNVVDDTNITVTLSPVGDQGAIGFTGSVGYTGSIGFTGSQGIQGVAGFTGSQGIEGQRGFTGSQGPIGYTGSKGTDGQIGFTGSMGLIGYVGSRGYTGSRGDTGFNGSQGLIGYTGSRGIDGTTGFTGSKGDTGYVGSQGIGYAGSRGPIGFTGSAGSLGAVTTDDITEGVTNLYFTEARVDTAIADSVTTASLQITGAYGPMTWNATEGTVDIPLNADVTLQVGQEQNIFARNLSGATVTNGKVVRVTGASGNKLTFGLASNTNDGLSASAIAVATQTITNNSSGYITVSGIVRGIDTSAYAEGAVLWLGTDGNYTTTKPLTPLHLVQVGWVVRSHATEGSIYVHIQNGYELEELHDVLITTPSDGDIIRWDGTNGYWKNEAFPISSTDISNWDTAYSWGNHADAGYLTDITTQSILDLSDVTGTGTYAGGEVLQYQNFASAFVPTILQFGIQTLYDVELNPLTLATNDVLVYNATTELWENSPILGDIDAALTAILGV